MPRLGRTILPDYPGRSVDQHHGKSAMSKTCWQGISIATLLFGIVGCASAKAVCSIEEAIAAETEAARLSDWGAIHASYKKFYHCDDGAIAEGYSESVTRMLEKRWNELPQLQSLMQKDERFRSFVLRHIDETMSRDRFEAIMQNARENCSASASTICAAIIDRLKTL